MLLALVQATNLVASAADVDFECTGTGKEGALGIIGVPPLEVTCTVLPPEEGSYSEVSWTVGDGDLHYGDSITHVYEDFGQFTISVKLEDFVPGGEAPAAEDAEHTRYGFVTVCGPPEPGFTYVNKGGLDFKLLNLSGVAPHCLDSSEWEVFKGEKAEGKPLFRFDDWEPRFELPEEGPWTIRLSQKGIGGATFADLVLHARYQLTDDLLKGPRAADCSTGPGAGLGWSWLGASLLALALARRR
jgi:hypothetical protein